MKNFLSNIKREIKSRLAVRRFNKTFKPGQIYLLDDFGGPYRVQIIHRAFLHPVWRLPFATDCRLVSHPLQDLVLATPEDNPRKPTAINHVDPGWYCPECNKPLEGHCISTQWVNSDGFPLYRYSCTFGFLAYKP